MTGKHNGAAKSREAGSGTACAAFMFAFK